ncbi:MAG: sulfotransferase [Geminicoccaceae bacterium]
MTTGDVFEGCAPIFVVGAARSGTTLMHRMLHAHPDIAIMDEAAYFEGILKVRPVLPDLQADGAVERFFDLLPRIQHIQHWSGMDEVLAEVKTRLAADPAPSYGRFYLLLMDALARQNGATRCGDKTPENVRYLPELAVMFPGCQIIHMIRDPRGNIASRLKLEWASDDVMSNAVKWKLDVRAGRRFGKTAAAGTYLEVRYEDLVGAPEATLQRVCAFLGEPYRPEMLSFYKSRSVLFKNEPWKDTTFAPVTTDYIETWRKSLSNGQLQLIELIVGADLRELGYRPAASHPAGMLAAVPQFGRELVTWIAHKRRERQLRRDQPNVEFFVGNSLTAKLLQQVRGRDSH